VAYSEVHFSGPAITEFHPRTVLRDWWFEVHESFTCRWRTCTICIPEGLSTDLASIPQLLQSIIPLVGNHLQAAIVHDMCYRYQVGVSKKDADDMFYDAMRTLGVSWLKAATMWQAVHLFGGRAFKGG